MEISNLTYSPYRNLVWFGGIVGSKPMSFSWLLYWEHHSKWRSVLQMFRTRKHLQAFLISVLPPCPPPNSPWASDKTRSHLSHAEGKSTRVVWISSFVQQEIIVPQISSIVYLSLSLRKSWPCFLNTPALERENEWPLNYYLERYNQVDGFSNSTDVGLLQVPRDANLWRLWVRAKWHNVVISVSHWQQPYVRIRCDAHWVSWCSCLCSKILAVPRTYYITLVPNFFFKEMF